MPKALSTFTLLCFCAGLTACSSGGGGSRPSITSISSWPSNFNNQSYSVAGISHGGRQYRDEIETNSTPTITNPNSITADISRSSAEATLKLDASGNLQAITLRPANNIAVQLDANTDTVTAFGLHSQTDQVISADSSISVLVSNPISNQWEYQTFATWITGDQLATSSSLTDSGTYGNLSAGFTTADNAIPVVGSATYSAIALGHYQSYDLSTGSNTYNNTTSYYEIYNHENYFTKANLSANVDFANRSIGLTTTSTQALEIANSSANAISTSNYDLTGSLSYAAGSNDLSGNFYFTTSGSTTPVGTINARFYGPNAEELGGTFSVNNPTFTDNAGNTIGNFQGSFGAKR